MHILTKAQTKKTYRIASITNALKNFKTLPRAKTKFKIVTNSKQVSAID